MLRFTFVPPVFFLLVACSFAAVSPAEPVATPLEAEAFWPQVTQSPIFTSPTGTSTAPPIALILYTPTSSVPLQNLQIVSPSATENSFLSAGCVQIAFNTDVTIPDGSILEPSESFEKTWRLHNTGTCDITADFELVYTNGNLPVPPAPIRFLQEAVPPGESFDISINLVAPNEPGLFRAEFQVRSPNGDLVGLGKDGSGTIYTEFLIGPSLDYSLSLEDFHLCSLSYMTIRIENEGNTSLKSLSVLAVDQETGKTIVDKHINTAPFMPTPKSCPPGSLDAAPGQIVFISFNIGDPRSKHNSTLFIEICSEEGLTGVCLQKQLSFLTP